MSNVDEYTIKLGTYVRDTYSKSSIRIKIGKSDQFMTKIIPSEGEIRSLVGANRFKAWTELCSMIDGLYEMDRTWGSGGNAWNYEYKYRRGGKTLCALYAKPDTSALMIIFGKEEREKFEAAKENFSKKTRQIYDDAKTYHDGKWVMFEFEDPSPFEDFLKILEIKKRPNRRSKEA